jgi:hypothetical protein
MRKPVQLLILFFSFTSCKVIFTEQTRKQAEANKIEFSKIQFYNSDKIVLKRTLSSNEVSVASGKVIVENGKYTEIIKIKKNTRGKCESSSNNNLNISFESGPNRSFAFSNNHHNLNNSSYDLNPDNCKVEKIYTIGISSNLKNKNILPLESVEKNINVCSVFYDGKKYTIELASMPYLLIKKSKFSKKQIRKRTVKGVKVE